MNMPYRFTKEYQQLIDNLENQIIGSKDQEEIIRLKRMQENFKISKILECYKDEIDRLLCKLGALQAKQLTKPPVIRIRPDGTSELL